MVEFIIFTAVWCTPCQGLHRDFDGHAEVVFVDVDAEPKRAREASVQVVPTVVAYRDGKEIGRRTGYRDKASMERWMHRMRGVP
jgi:thioredoxin-like negative regulator of GroEL